MTETTIWMPVTSADLLEMYNKALDIEQNSTLGSSVVISEWRLNPNGSDHRTIKLIVDQDRAQAKGLMK